MSWTDVIADVNRGFIAEAVPGAPTADADIFRRRRGRTGVAGKITRQIVGVAPARR